MASLLQAARVRQSCSGTGVANLTLLAAISSFQGFGDAFPVGSQVTYCVTDGDGVKWEVGRGTLISAAELSRDYVYASSASSGYQNNENPAERTKINLSANTHEVFNTIPPDLLFFLNSNGQIADPSPLRASIFVPTIAAMIAEVVPEDGEAVVALGKATIADGEGGLFRWDAADATAEDGIDTFRNANSATGLYKRVRLDPAPLLVYATTTALRAVDAAAKLKSGRRAVVLGRSAEGDQRPFHVQWDPASSATHDGAMVFRPTTGAAASGAGRWLRASNTPNQTFTNSDATPSIAGGNFFTTAGTPPSAITDFDDAYEGQVFVIQRGSADQTIRHNASLIDLGGTDLKLTASFPRAEFWHVGGVHRLLTARPLSASAGVYNLNAHELDRTGATDCLAGIHAGRDAAGSDMFLEFLPGTYLLSGAIVANVARQHWRAAGPLGSVTLKLAAGVSDATFRPGAADITLEGFVIDAGSGNSGSAGVAGTGVSITRFRMRNCIVKNAGGYNAYFANMPRPLVEGCEFINAGGISVHHVLLQSPATPVAAADTVGIRFINNLIDQSALGAGVFSGGLVMIGHPTYKILDPVVHDNRVIFPQSTVSSQTCIALRDAKGGAVTGNITSGGSQGFSGDACPDIVVDGNSFLETTFYAVELGDGADRAVVTNNALKASGGLLYGLSVIGGTPIKGIVFSGNTIAGTAGRSSFKGLGALINNAVDMTVSNNTIDGAGSDYGFLVQGSTKIAFSNNVIYGAPKKGYYLQNSTGKISITGGAVRDCSEHDVFIEATSAITIDEINLAGVIFSGGAAPGVTASLSGGAALGGKVSVINCTGNTFGSGAYWGDTLDLKNGILNIRGNGSPESVVAAGIGSRAEQLDASRWDQRLFSKVSGSSNTGWHVEKPAARADKNGTDQTSFPDATYTKVTFANEAYDRGGIWDASNSKFVADRPGVISIRALVTVTTPLVGVSQLLLVKNGAALMVGPALNTFNAGGNDILSGSWEDQCAAGDQYEVRAFCDFAGASGTIAGGVLYTWISGTIN